MNSNNLLTTVLRNFQCAFRNRGYWPTIYMMLLATTALLSFPRIISVSPSNSLMKFTRNRFSVSSSKTSQHAFDADVLIVPAMEPTAQHKVYKFVHDHSEPSTWRCSLSVMITSVSITSSLVNAFKHSWRLR